MTVKSYVDLIAWQKAMDLVEMVYRATMSFPRDEMYGLTAQVRKAAVSVPSNIAEGQARRTTADFLRFLSIACGSLAEADTQILIAERLGYLTASVRASVQTQTAEVGRLIHGLMNSLTPAPRT